jgi:hypothetical protein
MPGSYAFWFRTAFSALVLLGAVDVFSPAEAARLPLDHCPLALVCTGDDKPYIITYTGLPFEVWEEAVRTHRLPAELVITDTYGNPHILNADEASSLLARSQCVRQCISPQM